MKYKKKMFFLNNHTQSFIYELLLEWKHAEIYKSHNLGIRNKILLYGTTGNGKTTIAKHIARLSKLPFFEINAGMVIDSKIGSSILNIHNLLNEIKMPCIMFWDEVDTIGSIRGNDNNTAAGLENERMVNSILINLEKISNVIFIGATNRKYVLDSAFLRRFDVQFEITEPTDLEKEKFAKQIIEYYKLPPHFLHFLPDTTLQFKNYSEIKLFIVDLTRKYVLEKITNKTEELCQTIQ